MSTMEVNRRFGRYRIEALVGQGGMGSVYRARDVVLKREVALKVLHSDVGEDPERDARFLREARLLAAVRHPSVVSVFDYGAEGGIPYLAMEWIDGQALGTVAPSLDLETRLDVLETLAEALAAAHAQGIVHRDVKPANIVLDARNRPRLVDFGIAKRRALPKGLEGKAERDALSIVTNAATVMGTPRYMSPEQAITADVDARADQFAWGVTAYELLSGQHPSELLTDPLEPFPFGAPPPLAVVAGDASSAVCAVVDRAMSRALNARFGSMDELLQAFTTARVSGASGREMLPAPSSKRTESGRSVVVASPALIALESGPTVLAASPLAAQPRSVPSAGGAWVALLAVFCALPLLGAAIFLATRHHRAKEPERAAPAVTAITSTPTPATNEPPNETVATASAASARTAASVLADEPVPMPNAPPSARHGKGKPKFGEQRQPPAPSAVPVHKDDGPVGL